MARPGRILCIGLLCGDIISIVPSFIREDSDQRCIQQLWERGGNASNNSSVLAALGSDVEFFGTLAKDHFYEFFLTDMKSRGIASENCPVFENHDSPNSIVICSAETGSRTIIHNNGNLPELTFQDFKDRIKLENYSWIHIEGRNVSEAVLMAQYIQAYNKEQMELKGSSNVNPSDPLYKRKVLPVSVEVEKVRSDLKELLPFADVAFVGSDFAKFLGAKDSKEGVLLASKLCQDGCLIVCPWGDTGASYGVRDDNKEDPSVKSVPAFPPSKIVDSLGAGDTFDASVIHALHNGKTPEESVRFGCKIAGGKLGFQGFKKISELVDKETFKTFSKTQ